MSALASDIEDERRPSSSILSSRLTSNYQAYPSQYPSLGQTNAGWYSQQHQQAPSYSQYHDPQVSLHTNGTTPQKNLQQRYPPSFSKTSIEF